MTEPPKIILYYCLMATWIGLGDNTELFWVVLSQEPMVALDLEIAFIETEVKTGSTAALRPDVFWG
jgi:hypothetical protein